jgi:hypothetical protein
MTANMFQHAPDALNSGIWVVARVYREKLEVMVFLARDDGENIRERATTI